MAYKNKTYVAFHYGKAGNFNDGDKHYYHLMDAWSENEKMDFEFYNAHEINRIMSSSLDSTIESSLQERLRNTKLMILLMGQESKNRRWVKWELEQAIAREIPILVVDVTRKSNEINIGLLPDCLFKHRFGYTYYDQGKIQSGMKDWMTRHSSVQMGHHLTY